MKTMRAARLHESGKGKVKATPLNRKNFLHTGPGTLAGRYMRSFWQPICRAEDLKIGIAMPIKIMSEDFTLYRGMSGTPHLLEFHCAHRGAQLSIGRVEGDHLRCLYHGWLYDGYGKCVEQPAESKPFCNKIRINSYPTYEYLGLLFAYLGEGELPRRPMYKEFESEGFLLVVPPPLQLPCNYFSQIDNNGDMHVPFAHQGVLDTPGHPQTHGLSAQETDWGATWYESRPGRETRVAHFIMPNLVQNKRRPLSRSATEWTEALQWVVPVDDAHHLRFEVFREISSPELLEQLPKMQAEWFEMRSRVAELGNAVLQGRLRLEEIADPTRNLVQLQDYVIMASQGAIPDHSREHLGRSDAVVALRRKLWERELRALAAGQPLKLWHRPDWLETDRGHS